jgi:uncharacterized protein YutE (UPF0331/DUF86 family)
MEKSISLEVTESPSRTIEAVSAAGKVFHKEVNDIFNFLDIVVGSVASVNNVINQGESDESEQNIEENDDAQQTQYHKRWMSYSQLFLQMAVCRLIDNYSSYLSDVIREAIPLKPEILKSGEQVKLEYVLQFDTMSDFLNDLIDRKVTSLSYGGFLDIEKWCVEKLGLSLLKDAEQRDSLIELIETRNIFVHNRGKIGEKYLRNVSNTNFVLGQERLIDLDYLIHTITLLLSCGLNFDEKIAAKFSLLQMNSGEQSRVVPVTPT